MTHGLINPPVEAAACRKMIARAKAELNSSEHTLTSHLLNRDEYCQRFGEAQALRRLVKSLEDIYRKEFEV